MDLRHLNLSRERIDRLKPFILDKKLIYQPFVFDEDLEVGEGYAIMTATSDDETRKIVYWPGAPSSINGLTVQAQEMEAFREGNAHLRTVYESMIAFIRDNARGALSEKEILDMGCNTGYFPYRFSQLGTKRAIGIDQISSHQIFDWFNDVLDTDAEFIFGEWDSYIHNLRYAEMPEVDIVTSIAVLCHLSDPLFHISFLCNAAREAVFIWTPVRSEDEYLVSYGPPSRYSNMAWPLSFDHLVRPTRKLVELCLKQCGFEEFVYLPQFEGVNDWYRDFWRHHIGVLAFRTRDAATVYNQGETHLVLPADVQFTMTKQYPFNPKNPPQHVFTGKRHNIIYYKGHYYGVLHDLGAIDFDAIEEGDVNCGRGIYRYPHLELLLQNIPEDEAYPF